MQDTLVSSIRHWENQSWIKLWRWPMVANVAAMRNWPTHQNTSAISALGMNTTTTLGQTIENLPSFSFGIFQQTGCWYLPCPLRFSMMDMNKTEKIHLAQKNGGKELWFFSASKLFWQADCVWNIFSLSPNEIVKRHWLYWVWYFFFSKIRWLY